MADPNPTNTRYKTTIVIYSDSQEELFRKVDRAWHDIKHRVDDDLPPGIEIETVEWGVAGPAQMT